MGLFSQLPEQDKEQYFEDIFMQYSKPLFYYAAKFVDDEAARDIVQDVFLKLWNDPNIKVQKSFNSLIFTMVRNSCLQLLEKRKVRSQYVENARITIQEQELNFYMKEQTSLIEKEMEEKMSQVLESLPDRCKEIFLKSRFENKKNKEIADELGISVKAVEKQITRALTTIRVEMKEYLPLLIFLWANLFNDR